MNTINLEMDLDGQWLRDVAILANVTAQTKKPIRGGCFRFPPAFGNGFAEARIIEPGLSLCLFQLHPHQPITIQYGSQCNSDLFYCRYELGSNSPGFISQRAGYPLHREVMPGTAVADLILVMSRQWITDNLGLLAEKDGRLMEAYNAGLAYCSYEDKLQVTGSLRQRLAKLPFIVSSLRHVISKGIALELISLSWSNLILQRRPNTYVNKIA